MSRRLPTWALASLLAAEAGRLSAQDPAASAEAFAAAEVGAKKRIFADIAQQRLRKPSSEIARIIKVGLDDRDRDVRSGALSALTGHALLVVSAGRSHASAGQSEQWRTEHAPLRELRPSVLALLRDSDPRLRREAVRALGILDLEPGPGLTLTESTVDDLITHYADEDHNDVKVEIMKALALSKGDYASSRNLFLSGLDDADRGVRDYALLGAERLKLPAALDKAADLLRDPDRNRRLVAVGIMGSFEAQASGHVAALERALASETDPAVRSAIEQNLSKIRASR